MKTQSQRDSVIKRLIKGVLRKAMEAILKSGETSYEGAKL